MRRSLLVFVFASSLAAGCASTPETTPADSSVDLLGKTGKLGEGRLRPTAQPEALAGDPYAKTAGGVEAPRSEPTGPVAFVPPSSPLATGSFVASGRVRLAVAFVRDGQLVADPEALLEFEAQLEADEELRAVLALPLPDATHVDLEALANLAWRDARDLLLVEVREDQRRRAYLIEPRRVALLAEFTAGETTGDHEVTSAGPPDLLRRLGVAFVRLRR